jgi:hypothetical protein
MRPAWTVVLPSETMPSTRPNLTQPQPEQSHPARPHPRLDEKSFQGLLAAAFTIQEHNDRRKQAGPAAAELDAQLEPEATSVCPHCGALKPAEEARCQICSLEQFRPGERMQRNWASMWLMSQEQGLLWPERRPPIDAVRDSASNGLLGLPPSQETLRETKALGKDEIIRESVLDRSAFDRSRLDESVLDKPEADNRWTPEGSVEFAREELAQQELLQEDLSQEDTGLDDSDLIAHELRLPEGDDSSLTPAAGTEVANSWQRVADWRVRLRFHRADLYLGAAVVVAALALLWPAARSPRRPALGPFERALVSLGLAEAPAPVVHLQGGDPGIQVWVDPHTAQYYCQGEEQYGKTAGGRVSSQREAQTDHFEPAGRSVCE